MISKKLLTILAFFRLKKTEDSRLNLLTALFSFLWIFSFASSAGADDIDTYIQKHSYDVKPNILFILDQSGSMAGTKQSQLKDTMIKIIDSSAYENFNVAFLTYRFAFAQTRITPLIPFTRIEDDSRPELRRIITQLYPFLGTPTTPAYFFGANWFVDKYDHDYKSMSTPWKPFIRKNVSTDIFLNPPDGFYDQWDSLLKYYPGQRQGPIVSEQYCAPNSIILLTDGAPNAGFQTFGTDLQDPRGEARWDDEFTLNTRYEADGAGFRSTERDCNNNGTSPWTSGHYKSESTTIGGCVLDAARFLANTDLRPDEDIFPGVQNITTHTIGFGIGDNTTDTYKFINDIAKAGNGGTYLAQNEDDLTQAFQDIFYRTEATVPYSYNSPSIAIDLSNPNSSGKYAYVPLSKPQLTDIWYGNLKKYQYLIESDAARPMLRDVNNNNALDSDGEFLKTQQDYWASTRGGDIINNGVAGLLNARTDRTIFTEAMNQQNTNTLMPISQIGTPINATTANNNIYQHRITGDASKRSHSFSDFFLSLLYDIHSTTGLSNMAIKNSIVTLSFPTGDLGSTAEIPTINHIKVQHHPGYQYQNSSFQGSTLKIYRDNETTPAYSKTFNTISKDPVSIYPRDNLGNYINASKIEWIAPQNDTYSALTTFNVFINENSVDRGWFTSTPLSANSVISITGNNGNEYTRTISKMGAPLHTKPLEVDYPEINKSIIYLPTSEGVLHAFDADTGKEEWGFIPSELLGNITTLRKNPYSNNTETPIYGLDGQPRHFTLKKKTGNNLADVNQEILVFGMRRGGNNYFALDITDPYNPVFLWKIQGGTGDFKQLGQTWATPSPIQMKLAGKSTPVLVLSGGYDSNNDIDGDPDNANNTSDGSNNIGNAIYFVNARTGTRIFWISDTGSGADLVLEGMKNSIVTDPEIIKLDNDDYIDRLYFSDLGGRIIRVDIDNENNSSSGNLLNAISAAILADVNDNDAPPNRQFFNKPTVSKLRNLNGETVFGISIGSGFRPNLLSKTAITDRFYTIFDKQPYADQYSKPIITTNDLYDATDNILQNTDNDEYSTALNDLNSKSGWYIDLGSSLNPAEKSINKAAIHDGVVYFTTYLPEIEGRVNVCELGSAASNSRFYSLDLKNATAVNPANNGNPGDLVTTDRSTLLKRNIGIAPEINISRVTTLTTGDDNQVTESIGTIITPCLQCSKQIDAPDYLRGLSWEELR